MKATTILSIALYKPTPGNEEKLMEILKEHVPALRKYELITPGTAYTAKSTDGTIIEVFEWTGEAAKNAAHEHPAIRTIWGKMEGICEFPALQNLAESKKRFPGFDLFSTNP
jgi:hypothetical protein